MNNNLNAVFLEESSSRLTTFVNAKMISTTMNNAVNLLIFHHLTLM